MTPNEYRNAADLTPEERRRVMPKIAELIAAFREYGIPIDEIHAEENGYRYEWRRGKN